MAFPTSDVNTQHFDDPNTDSPAEARGSLLDLVQKFNGLRAFFNSFWLGLLATTSQATARGGLGATTVGSAVFTAVDPLTARTAIGAIGPDGTVANANNVPWTGVTGRPTDLGAFSNGPGYSSLSLITSATYATNTTHNITVAAGKKALVMVSYNGGQAGNAGVQADFQWGIGSLANTRQFASGGVDYQTPFGFSMQTVITSTSSNLQIRLSSSGLDGGYGAPANFYLTVLEF